jgi:hypothetical protein
MSSGKYLQPIRKSFLSVSGGTVVGNTTFSSGLKSNVLSADDILIGDINLHDIFSKIIKYADREIPEGALDGENCIFYLKHIPIKNSEHIFLNGVLQDPEEESDYSIFENSIIFNFPPTENFKIRCSYRHA